ncbi:MAG: hypothetical protein JWN74_684 [Acidobacteriaceae bacterium]|nr:hypothetical protein [Acidobacteriaceae bacterium]
MNRELAKKVADAVLYEGYMLYPYRHSAIKNQQRWTFGILYPPAYEEVQSGTERSVMHSECLLEFKGDARIDVQVRFLQLVSNEVTRDDQGIESRDEGIERSVEFRLTLPTDWHCVPFNFPAGAETESLVKPAGRVGGHISRTQHELTGTVTVASERISDGVMKLAIEVTNETRLSGGACNRNSALLRSLLSAHTILAVNGAEFVSLLDPPEQLREAVRACKNIGNFPVLVGNAGERDMLLCSPIVLYDYPQIAPESSGDFYDATEIDEMLTLRVMTLTNEEKAEMRIADDRVRDLLQRTEERAREQLMRTHGTIRGLRPSTPPRRESA